MFQASNSSTSSSDASQPLLSAASREQDSTKPIKLSDHVDTTAIHHSRQFWVEFTLVCLVVMLSESSRGLVIPTLSSFVKDLGGNSLMLSIAISVYSGGRLLATTLIGYIGDSHSTRSLLQGSIIVCIVGNIVYVTADYLGPARYGLYVLLFSRALTGMGTAVVSTARAHVAATTAIVERTKFISWLGIVNFIGFAFSPALGGLGFDTTVAGIPVTTNTISTYVLAILDVILLIGVQIYMTRTKPNQSKPQQAAATESTAESNNSTVAQHHSSVNTMRRNNSDLQGASVRRSDHESHPQHHAQISEQTSVMTPSNSSNALQSLDHEEEQKHDGLHRPTSVQRIDIKPDITKDHKHHFNLHLPHRIPPIHRPASVTFFDRESLAPWIFVMLNLTGRGILAVSETYATLLYFKVVQDDSDSARSAAGYWFTAFGVGGVIVNFLVPYMEKFASDRRLLEISLLVSGIGFALLTSWHGQISFICYLIGMACIWSIGCPLNQTLAVSMMSKHLGNSKQAKWMAMITASGSVGRIVCPLLAGLLTTELKYGQNSAYLLCVVLSILSWLLTMVGIGKPAHEKLAEQDDESEHAHEQTPIKHDSKSYDSLSSSTIRPSNTTSN